MRYLLFPRPLAVTGIFLCHAALSLASAQTETLPETGWAFLPGGTLFPSLVANHQEPRTGLSKDIGSSRMKLDIGASLDLLEWQSGGGTKTRLRMGVDFFTYALTTSSQGLRLQVDAVDGFFGGHVLLRWDTETTSALIRLRLLHLSAHMVDGHYDMETMQWKDGRTPIPFTRDFGELLGAYRWYCSGVTIMPYAGFSYATLVRPDDIQRWAGLAGAELRTRDSSATVWGKPFGAYVAYQCAVSGVPEYIGSNSLVAGVKFGRWEGTGITVFLQYASGLEVFGQYYNVRHESWRIGFTLDVL